MEENGKETASDAEDETTGHANETYCTCTSEHIEVQCDLDSHCD